MDARAASDWGVTGIGYGGDRGCRIVAVLRASDAGRFERVPKVLVEAGVTCVELTSTSRGAVAALPGAFTPPRSCGPGGPAYLRPVKAPLPAAPLVPTGGVGLEEIGRCLDAGALAVGLGGPLVGGAGEGGHLGPLRRRANAAVTQVREAHAR